MAEEKKVVLDLIKNRYERVHSQHRRPGIEYIPSVQLKEVFANLITDKEL